MNLWLKLIFASFRDSLIGWTKRHFCQYRRQSLRRYSPRRMLGLRTLVDDATQRGVSERWINNSGLRVTPLPTGCGRYMRLGGSTVWFGISFDLWAGNFDTPLWLDYRGIRPGAVSLVQLRRILGLSHGEEYVPIPLPVGVEYEAVLGRRCG